MSDEIRIEYMPLSKLVRAPRNAKTHDLQAIAESMQRFGYVASVIVDDATGRLVAGHGRLDTLQSLKAQGQPPPDRIRVNGDEPVFFEAPQTVKERIKEAEAVQENQPDETPSS